jgi:hypothetical protein
MLALMNNIFLYDRMMGIVGTVVLGLVFLGLGIMGYKMLTPKK